MNMYQTSLFIYQSKQVHQSSNVEALTPARPCALSLLFFVIFGVDAFLPQPRGRYSYLNKFTSSTCR